jgi:hypothetical protein
VQSFNPRSRPRRRAGTFQAWVRVDERGIGEGRAAMSNWNVWRSALAGAMIGLIEAAGLAAVRPAPAKPLRLVRPAPRMRSHPLAGIGLWFLDPLADPRPAPTDQRRGGSGRLSLLVPRQWGTGRYRYRAFDMDCES